jgi:hypothetical protein
VFPQHAATGSAERSARAGRPIDSATLANLASVQPVAAAWKLSARSNVVNALPPLAHGMNKEVRNLYNG